AGRAPSTRRARADRRAIRRSHPRRLPPGPEDRRPTAEGLSAPPHTERLWTQPSLGTADAVEMEQEGGKAGRFFGDCSEQVIGAGIEVHRALGPGLLESAYEECLAHEFRLRGLEFERQWLVPVEYKGIALACGYRLDFLVERSLVVEIKSLERLLPVHE